MFKIKRKNFNLEKLKLSEISNIAAKIEPRIFIFFQNLSFDKKITITLTSREISSCQHEEEFRNLLKSKLEVAQWVVKNEMKLDSKLSNETWEIEVIKVIKQSPSLIISEKIADDYIELLVEQECHHGNLETIVSFKGAGRERMAEVFLEKVFKING